ncbi:MAG TPA: hypothetical protein V6D14_35435 [Coleofasciculaceae cyanobacterium]
MNPIERLCLLTAFSFADRLELGLDKQNLPHLKINTYYERSPVSRIIGDRSFSY